MPPSKERGKALIAVVGPTATGKSALALRLALHFRGEIVNCDAMQMVRGMDIGTAKPDRSEREQVPHHLFDLIDPDEFYSAGRYMSDARNVIRAIADRGRMPIVVGGTGLYLRALLEGVFEGPGKSDAIRLRLKSVLKKRGPEYLHRILERKDPATAGRVPTADHIRMIRALEVYFVSGVPISRWKPRKKAFPGFSPLKLGILLPRDVLYARIEQRVERMFLSGLLDEVALLLKQGYGAKAKGFEAIGYRSALGCLEGRKRLEEAIEETARDTRHYAKRQMTWFRRESDIQWIHHAGEKPEALTGALQIAGRAFFPNGVETKNQG